MKSLLVENRKQDIINAELPVYENTRNNKLTYTVIPHKLIIDSAEQLFGNNELNITKEYFINTDKAQVVRGTYTLDYEKCKDFKMTYSFTNSYNKQVRFESAIGLRYEVNDCVIINKLNDWQRKHTGTADTEAVDTMSKQINFAKSNYDEIINDLNFLKDVFIGKQDYCYLIGQLFGNEIMSSSQLNILHSNYKTPKFNYGVADKREGLETKKSLYCIYLDVCYALKEDHPVNFMQDLAKAHAMVMAFASTIKQPVEEPNLFTEYEQSLEMHDIPELGEEPAQEEFTVDENPIEKVKVDDVEIEEQVSGISEPEDLDSIRKELESMLTFNEEEIKSFDKSQEKIFNILSGGITIDEPQDKELSDIIDSMDYEQNEQMKNDIAMEEYERDNNIQTVTEEEFVKQEEEIKETKEEKFYFGHCSYPYSKGETFEDNGVEYFVEDVFDGILICRYADIN